MFKRLVTGSSLSVIALMANILTAMIMMPFIIHSLGDVDYGLWVLVASFVGYYGLLDFGMSAAATRFISRADGKGDVEEMNIILNTVGVFFAGLGFTVFIISVIVASMVESQVTAALWLTVGITCIFQFGLRGFYGLYFARIRQDILSYTTIAKLIFRTALIYYFLSTGYGVVAVAVITMVAEILFYGIDMILLKKIVPEMKISWDLVRKERVKKLINYGKFSMVLQISDLLKLRALPVIVTYTVGLTCVVYFSIAMRLMEIYQEVMHKIIGIVVPVFSQYEARDEHANIKKAFWMTFRINVMLSILFGAGIMLFSGNFINWWIGEEYEFAYGITLWLSVGLMAFTINETGKSALFGVSKHQTFAWVSMLESIAAAMLGAVLGYLYGPLYIAIGMASVFVYVELVHKPFIVVDELNLSLKEYYLTLFNVGIRMGIPVAIWAYVGRGWHTTSIWYIMLGAGLFVISLIPAMWFSLGDDNKEILRRKVLSRLSFKGIKC